MHDPASAPARQPRPGAAAAGGTIPVPVLIVGGGPTGLAAALLLARHGIACTVVESRHLADATADGRLLALSLGTLRILGPLLGAPAGAPVATLAAELPGAAILRVRVSSAGEFGTTTLQAHEFGADALGVTVRYGALLGALDARVRQQHGITLLRPTQVRAVDQAPDAAHVLLDDGARFAARAVIRAEGIGPAAGGGPAQAPVGAAGSLPSTDDPGAWAIVGDVRFAEASGPAAGDAIERFTREGPFALLPAPESPRAWSIVWCMRGRDVAARMALDDGAFLAAVGERIGARCPAPTGAGPRQAWPLRQHALRDVQAHRVVHVGNAAQTLHPVAGQGFNLGVRDVRVLVDRLADAFAEGRKRDAADAANAGASRSRGAVDPVLDALALHARQRRADRAALGLLTGALPEVFATPFAPVASARSLGLLALDALPPVRRLLGHLLMFGVRT